MHVDHMTYVFMCICIAADSDREVAKRELCVSAAMRVVDDTSMRQCIFLLMSISQHVLALHVLKSVFDWHSSVCTCGYALLPSLHQTRTLAGVHASGYAYIIYWSSHCK